MIDEGLLLQNMPYGKASIIPIRLQPRYPIESAQERTLLQNDRHFFIREKLRVRDK